MATATEVRLIMKKTEAQLSDTQAAPFIDVAEEIVDGIFEGDGTIGATLLEEIKKWMSAHLIASTILRMTSEETLGDASVKYTGKWGEKLSSTPYGQAILIMDRTGKMANAGKMAASIYAIKNFDD